MRTGAVAGKTNEVRGSCWPSNSLHSEGGTLERDTLDFGWRKNSWSKNGTCVTERQLPDKDIVGIRTGQVDRDGSSLWEAERWFEESGRLLDAHLSSATSGEPAARGVFDVYLGLGAEGLIFVKAPCAHADTEAKFFLHLIPADEDDLPAERKRYGFDNLDFGFEAHGERLDGNAWPKSLSRNTASPKSGPVSRARVRPCVGRGDTP